MILVVAIQVPLSMCEKKMALCKMWVAEVEREPTILSAAIHSSLQVFGSDRMKPVKPRQCKRFSKDGMYS